MSILGEDLNEGLALPGQTTEASCLKRLLDLPDCRATSKKHYISSSSTFQIILAKMRGTQRQQTSAKPLRVIPLDDPHHPTPWAYPMRYARWCMFRGYVQNFGFLAHVLRRRRLHRHVRGRDGRKRRLSRSMWRVASVVGTQHFAMLTGHADLAVEARVRLQSAKHGRHLDGLGPGAEYREYSHECSTRPRVSGRPHAVVLPAMRR